MICYAFISNISNVFVSHFFKLINTIEVFSMFACSFYGVLEGF